MKIQGKHLFILICFLNGSLLIGQKEQTIFFGVNVGTKLANKNYAVRYSGLYNGELENTLLYNTYNYNQIFMALGDKNFYLPYDAYPTNIRYSPGILTGVTVGYQVSPNFQMSLDANFSILKVKDAFTIHVDDPNNFTTEPVIVVGSLYAEESRFDGRYNLDYVMDGGKVKFMYGLSGLFNAWRIDEHFATLKGYQMNLFSKHNPSNNFFNKVSGMGWGFGANIGFEYRVNEKIVAQILYQPYQTKVDYGFTPAKKLLIQHDLTARILWK
ncbi:MAG: hypothetical protein JNJ99_14965 [Crocinitomicaceae bacterium]|nr:hypothetical protein [Crocinitomicaceae bacterium]